MTKAELLKENPDSAEAELPESQEERDRIIETNQFVGRACYNEMLCRQVVSYLRALVKCAIHYNCEDIDFAVVVPFEPTQEDEEHFGIMRPRIAPRNTDVA